MNCSDCVERLDSYLDRELNEHEVEQVRKHLTDCPPCEHVFQLRSDLKRLVKICCDEAAPASGLRDKVRNILT